MDFRLLLPTASVIFLLLIASALFSPHNQPTFLNLSKNQTSLSDQFSANRTEETGIILRSPNKLYQLDLETDGSLRLINAETNRSIFWSNTGDGWDGVHQVELAEDGVLRTYSRHKTWDERQLTWHSNLMPNCVKAQPYQSPYLHLSDTGEMKILTNDSSTPLCTLTNKPQDVMGRLALLVTGMFRTNQDTCKSHVEKVIKTWPGQGVDVLWLTYLQDAYDGATEESITKKIRDCYGDVVKDIIILDADKVAKPFPYEATMGCGQWHIDRLNSQLKTVFLAGRQLQKYILSSGTRYEYVLRLRPDTLVWGDIEWERLGGAHDHKIILPHPGREHYYYCSTPLGELTVGPTDQLAFGRTSDMFTWLDMYSTFPYMMEHGQRANASRDYFGCEHLPDSPDYGDCHFEVPCAVECFVGYWLTLRGIPFEISWHWGQNLLRRGGHQAKNCGLDFNCPGN